MEKFKEALQNCDTVKVILTGVGETEFSTKELYESTQELERLAETKMVTKNKPIKVTKSPYNIAFCPKCKGSVWQNKDESKFCFRCGQMISW